MRNSPIVRATTPASSTRHKPKVVELQHFTAMCSHRWNRVFPAFPAERASRRDSLVRQRNSLLSGEFACSPHKYSLFFFRRAGKFRFVNRR
jgi:hypothetical protein